MNTAIQFFGSTLGEIPLASPMEPETTRAILNFRPRPKVNDQFNIDGWIKDIKTAAGLSHGFDNLDTVFDVVYLFGTNTRRNARIDFVRGVLLAEEININEDDFIQWEGFYSSVSQSRAVDTKWNIGNPENKGQPDSHHIHIASLVDTDESSTSSFAGISGYSFAPLQSVSGNLRFRFRSGTSTINNYVNDNVLGSYTIKGESESDISYQKNDMQKVLTGNRSDRVYENYDYYILGVNTGSGVGSTREGMKIGSFTAGSVAVDGALLAEADKNYFAKYGITIY